MIVRLSPFGLVLWLSVGLSAPARAAEDPPPATAPHAATPHATAPIAASPLLPPDPPATAPADRPFFTDPEDGAFDVSGFLATRAGFLPIVVPITEPAVGFGAAVGLAYFHETPTVRPGPPGAPKRLNLPTTTMLMGGGTENDTWFTGLFHMGIWNEGRIRYLGGVGYGSINLDWYGRNDAFNGKSISYNNEVFGFYQSLMFQIGNTPFAVGPQYRFTSTQSDFSLDDAGLGIPTVEFDSHTSGVGLTVGYDTRDVPFAPTRGMNASIAYLQNAEWLGSDFDYYSVNAYAIFFVPIAPTLVLGVHIDGTVSDGQVPFYDLPFVNMRGVPATRYVDNVIAQVELELRWDITKRWSVVGFAGAGWTADNVSDLTDSDAHPAGGVGFRYLIAREYGIRMGVDVAYGEDGAAVYVAVGTGWVRP